MGRSGTSAVAGSLAHMGLPMGRGLLAGDRGNPYGYFEDLELSRLNERLHHAGPTEAVLGAYHAAVIERCDFAPLWGVKDPRFCEVGLIVESIVREYAAPVMLVVAERDRRAILSSFRRTYGFGVAETLDWYVRRRWALRRLRREFKGPQLTVRFEHLVEGTPYVRAAHLQRLGRFVFGRDVDIVSASEFIRPREG